MKNWIFGALFISSVSNMWGQARDSVYWTDVEDSLRNKTIDLRKKSRFEEALLTAKQFAQIAEKNSGPLNTRTADALFLLATCYRDLGNYDSSEVVLGKALSIRKQISGEEHIETLSIIIELAAVNRLNLKSLQAESNLLKAKLLLEKTNQIKERNYRICLGNLAEVCQDKGDFEEAETLYLEVKKIKEAQFGKESASYGATVHDLGNVYWLSGRLEEALNAYKSALDIFLNKLGRDHPYTANAYGNIGRVLIAFGDYGKCEEMLLEAVAIRKKIYGASSRYYTFSITELATFYLETGRTTEGISLLEEARKILTGTGLSESQDFGITVSNLASAYAKTGDLIKAELYVKESKDVIEKTLGKESVYYAMSLCQLAEVYRAAQRYAEAEKLIEEELDVWTKKQNIEDPQYCYAMKETAAFFIETSNLERAEGLLKVAKNRTETVSGKNNLIYIGIIERLSQVLAKLGKDSEAQTLIVEANERERNLLKRETNAFTEKDLKNFMEEVGNSSNILFEFLLRKAYNKPTIAGSAFDNLLFYKGYLLQGVREMQWAMAFADDSTHQIYNRWKGYHRQLSQQYALPIADRQNTAMIEEKANALEKLLVSKVTVFGRARQQVDWREVLAQLKPNEAAIEFAKFQIPDKIDSVYYCALVLQLGYTAPQFIPLFEKNALKELMSGASGGSNFLKINELYSQKALYDLIWKPLEPMLTGIKTVYCAPSGLLHRLNLAAIPTPEGQVYGQRRQLVVLGSTRQLAVGSSSSSQAVAQDAYLAGGIRYDSDSTLVAYANRGATSRNADNNVLPFQPDSLSITRGGVLEYLPATAAEVGELSQTLRSAGYQTQTDTGFYATEESFRRLGTEKPSPRVVHLATHGYFFPDPAVSKKQLAIGNEPVFKISDHPMIRSGLILAGAKQAWLTGKHPEGQEDGILTAYEISQMNLSNTELVVLSACETGLGDIVGNEGVYGLQRAFKIAGAKYLIMSLWKVDDQSTRAFMSAFYRHWLTDKQTVPQAFRSTQQEMRAKYSGAYDWAGFVLIE